MTANQDPRAATLDAVLLLLQAGSLTAEDLIRHAEGGASATTGPTVADYVRNSLIPTLSPGQRKTWEPYLKLLTDGYPTLCACSCDACLDHFRGDSKWTACACLTAGTCNCASRHWQDAETAVSGCLDQFAGYGDRPLSQLSVTELSIAARWAKLRARKRVAVRSRNRARDGRPTVRGDGRHAVEQFRAATSALYRLAVKDAELGGVRTNLALEVSIQKRPVIERRAYTADQLEELWQALFTSGSKDIELDMLIVWSMLELGARRGGPITMKIGDMQIHSRTVRLGEKNDKIDNQPASPALIMTLLDHALRRGGDIVVATIDGLDACEVTPLDVIEGRARLNTEAPVLYYKPRHSVRVDEGGHTAETIVIRPLTRKRFETLFDRLKRELPWLDEMHGRPHDLRRTGATFIERAFGTAVAQRWLRHTVQTAIGTYVAAGDDEVRDAHAWWTGQSEVS
jgi:integrase